LVIEVEKNHLLLHTVHFPFLYNLYPLFSMSEIVGQEKIPAESDSSTATSIVGIDVVTSDGEINDIPPEETTKFEDPAVSSDDTRRTVSGFKACRFRLCNSIFYESLTKLSSSPAVVLGVHISLLQRPHIWP
jgi:hypothetical protein